MHDYSGFCFWKLHIIIGGLCYIFHVFLYLKGGPVLMAVWSKAPPLIAGCLSPLPGFESWPGALSIKVCAKCWIYGPVACCLRRPLRRKYKAARR